MIKKRLSSEMLIGLTAMINSLSTLVVFVYQTNLIKKQQYMSVYPHLSIIHNNSNTINYEYILRNQGIGPAFITSIEVKDEKGRSYNSIRAYVNENINDEDDVDYLYSDIFEGTLIQEKEELDLFSLSGKSGEERSAQEAHDLRKVLLDERLKLKITYESIYGERWTMSNHTNRPIKH